MIFYKTKNNTFILDKQEWQYCDYIIINDTIKIKYSETCEISEQPTKVVACKNTKNLIGYKNKDGEFISVYDYTLKKEELHKYSDADGDFTDLDREYDFKKFIITWHEHVYKDEVTILNIDFAIRNLVYSEHADIIPLYQYGTNFTEPSCHLKLNIKQVLKDVATELGMYAYYEKKYSECKIEIGEAMAKGKHIIEIADNQGIRFSRFNRNYFKCFESYQHDIITYNGTYQECIDYKKEKYDTIKKELIKLSIEQKTNLLKMQEIDAIITKIASIYDDFNNITPHTKNYKQYSIGLTKLQNLYKELKELKEIL